MAKDINSLYIEYNYLKKKSRRIKLHILYLSTLENVSLRNKNSNYGFILGIQHELHIEFNNYKNLCFDIINVKKMINE